MAFGKTLTPKGFKSQVEVPKAPPPKPFRPKPPKPPKPPPPPPPTPKEELKMMTEQLKAEAGIEGPVVVEEEKPAAREAIAASLQAVLISYADDPVGFVRDILQAQPDPWQADLLMAVVAGTRRISVRAGHGVGKSSVCAWLSIWQVLPHCG